MTGLKVAQEQIHFARWYCNHLLDDIGDSQWFIFPAGAKTHIGWQIAHLTMAQFRLTVQRIRGEREDDEQIISQEFLQRYGKGSVPQEGAENNLSADTIRNSFESVHQLTTQLIADLPEDRLDESVREHPAFKTLLGAIVFTGQHELLHAGQIALLRRLLGKDPLI